MKPITSFLLSASKKVLEQPFVKGKDVTTISSAMQLPTVPEEEEKKEEIKVVKFRNTKLLKTKRVYHKDFNMLVMNETNLNFSEKLGDIVGGYDKIWATSPFSKST